MLPIKNLFGFRKNKGLDKRIIQKNPYRNNTDLNKRQFIKKGLLGMAGLGGLALASKVAKAGGLVFNDGSTQAAGSLEGTSIKSTSETGGTKFLREDGDGSCSWQAADIIKGGDIASASPLVIDTDGDYFDVTGTVSFAAMTVAADRQFTLQFDGALVMTHHATNLDLPGEANITTAAGDVGVFQSTGADTVQCISYTKADGTAVVSSGLSNIADSGGDDVAIATGNLVISTSGKGIDFSATGDGVTMASELFDDYEEGTFTVTLTSDGGGEASYTSNHHHGTYVKVGRVVHVSIYMRMAVGTMSAGNLVLGGFPFAGANFGGLIGGSSFLTMGVTHTANYGIVGVSMNNTATPNVYEFPVSSSGARTYLTDSSMTANTYYLGEFIYFT
jgi:hypothetical protein